MKLTGTPLIAAIGLSIGLLVGFVMPSSWVFVDDAKNATGHDHTGHGPHEMDGTKYACPMFCTIMDHLPQDGRCPVCGMDMTPVSANSTLNEHERRMVGLQLHTVGRKKLAHTMRLVGEVDYDETRLSRITTRVQGWLERVVADTTWATVTKGQELAAIYAPELYAAQNEYFVARKGANDENDPLVRAARRRLALLGIGAADIAQLKTQDGPQETLTLRAPQDGVIVERNAVQGASVKMGAMLYTIADLSRVWVQAEVFEMDLAWVSLDQSVRVEVDGRPTPIVGRVAFVDPVINSTTRTARVRVEVENPASANGVRALRVGQRVDVWIDGAVDAGGQPVAASATETASPLVVPRSAVLSTGKRRVVYVVFTERDGKRKYDLDPARLPETVFYQMLPVSLGPVATAIENGMPALYYPLVDLTLSPSEKRMLEIPKSLERLVVVARGNLLLDSQAQLSGKPSLLFPDGSRGSTDPHAGH